MTLSNKQVEEYLTDVQGYDELFIDELKETHIHLKDCLEPEELEECINYS